MDTRKRKRVIKSSLFSFKSLVMCFSFLLFLLSISHHHFRMGSTEFRPTRIVPNLSLFSSSITNSIQDMNHGLALELRIEESVLFTHHVLLILSTNGKHPRPPHLGDRINCVYHKCRNESSSGKEVTVITYPMLSVDEYHNGRWIIRCPLPPANYSVAVGLTGHWSDVAGFDWVAGFESYVVK